MLVHFDDKGGGSTALSTMSRKPQVISSLYILLSRWYKSCRATVKDKPPIQNSYGTSRKTVIGSVAAGGSGLLLGPVIQHPCPV